MKTFPFILALGFCLIGVGLLFAGISTLIKRISRKAFMRRTQGTVVSVESKNITIGSGRHSTNRYFFPVIEYTAESGHKRKFRSNTGGGDPNEYQVGTNVEVIYDVENPEDEAINSRFSVYGLSVSLIIAGILATVAAGFVMMIALKK